MKAKQLFRQIGIFSALLILIVTHSYATNQKPKILFVVTSHDSKGNTGEKTGYYLGEESDHWPEPSISQGRGWLSSRH